MMLVLGADSLEPQTMEAQAPDGIAPSQLVRLTVQEPNRPGAFRRVEGHLVRLDADSVVIADPTHERATALDALLRIEVRSPRGHGPGAVRGLGWGASLGGLAGALLGGLNTGDDPGGSAIFVGLLFGAVGGGIGAAIGTAWPGERWMDIPLTPGTRRKEDGT